ncbi:[protein-PII] uridylyltransferase [Actibacterium pelagium]|uniref:Bifunctional uridylyltransferase/uridylyl-removing enzyme n=1 Tax=Actibacterium pelagium TaxID=2029103 RepID=A0A917AA14_9RHOB|nr:[protein-PII] uridylyltransferase [Actibacterium pelagium]GGE37595.1 bifunctional uridylyltransferase/uridylyl-removing enzyme [Actibacterium pelagium]
MKTPEDLICPAQEIFDAEAFRAALDEYVQENGREAAPLRKWTVKTLLAANKAGRARIAEAIADNPFHTRGMVRAYAYLTDGLVTSALTVAEQHLHPSPTPTAAERLTVLAVGGYGRAEMAPQSDVDLLFLTPWKITAWAESVIESTLYILWDLRLKVGHASRTIRDCINLGREDYTIRTTLLETRHIFGEETLAEELREKLRSELFQGTAGEFVEAKLAERAERHTKQGGQRYMLEPNVKEGKGGLRDLQSLYWIAKYVHGVDTVAELLEKGVFTEEELDSFQRAEDFLWAVRCQLHLVSGRAMDQLTFDMQIEVAPRLGYTDRDGRRDVEHFMQDYFRHATKVGELTRIFLTALEESHVKSEPMLTRIFRRKRKAKPGYRIFQNRLDIEDEDQFFEDRLNILRIFEEALRTGTLIHPNAMRMISAHLDEIDENMRDDPEAQRIFIDLLLKHGNPERGLRRMNELGVLSAFIPEFEPIVAMMQFNVYHQYTVDEHTIQVISTLAQIEREELIEELPLSSSILKKGLNRKVLYVALLLHDIGKGRPEDHSVLGAQIARRVAPRLGLKKSECETVEWLVRYHLLMSDIAQKRDISDPRTARDFAKLVKNRKRLDLLTVLTVCDIRGVGPGTWNNWKAQLIRNLYRQTTEALENGLEAINTEARENEARKALREALSDWDKKDLRIETGRHYGPYWQGLPTEAHQVFARLLQGISDDEIRLDLQEDKDRDATRICFALADHPGIFARLSGALALAGANVVDARTYTSKDGYATAVFWVQDADGHPYEDSRIPRMRQVIGKILKGEVVARDKLADRDKMKKRERGFRFPTSISFDNEGSEIYTIIEVDTRDRPGLLFDVAQTLAHNNIYIASAVIATYGAQAVDSFYVKDMFGLKLHSQAKRDALEKRLREAIERNVERAEA